LVPSAMMLPKVGVGGWMPMPMKPKIDSKIIMRATSSTATKAIGGRMFGAIMRVMMRRSVAPRILAPRTYSFCRSVRVTLRATRA
jgi:hypothetical protein